MRFAVWHNMTEALRLIATILIVITTAISCNNETTVVAMSDVNIAQWSEPASVSLKNEQAESIGELTIVLHVNRNFKAEQIELEIESLTADSLRYSEKIAASPIVEWPIVTAQSVDIEIAYRNNVQMRKVGLYNYTITPIKPLQGVESVGMSYKSVKK